jgi:hypothetical protein
VPKSGGGGGRETEADEPKSGGGGGRETEADDTGGGGCIDEIVQFP